MNQTAKLAEKEKMRRYEEYKSLNVIIRQCESESECDNPVWSEMPL